MKLANEQPSPNIPAQSSIEGTVAAAPKKEKQSKPKELSRSEQILELLQEKAMTHGELAEKLGVERPAIHQALVKMVNAGKLARTKSEKGPFVYSIVRE